MRNAIIVVEMIEASRIRIPVMMKEFTGMWLNTSPSVGAFSIPPTSNNGRDKLRGQGGEREG